jgi:hypothetical protein
VPVSVSNLVLPVRPQIVSSAFALREATVMFCSPGSCTTCRTLPPHAHALWLAFLYTLPSTETPVLVLPFLVVYLARFATQHRAGVQYTFPFLAFLLFFHLPWRSATSRCTDPSCP